jgi:tetratricopeptide (TPR) repeat protein
VVGAWFFLILAPSSSFVALNQNLEEHRMYLSLAAVLVLTVMAGAWLLQRLPVTARSPFARGAAGVLVLALAAGLTAQTINRNHDYRSPMALWRQNIEHRPTSLSAHLNLHMSLGMKLFQEGKLDEAIAEYRAALVHKPKHAPAWYNLGCALAAQRKFADAAADLRKAIALSPHDFKAYTNLGAVLVDQEKPQEAVPQLRRALEIAPDFAKAHFNLANAFVQQGKLADAIAHYQQALRLKSDYWQAHLMLGQVYHQLGRQSPAIHHLQQAEQLGSVQARQLLRQLGSY